MKKPTKTKTHTRQLPLTLSAPAAATTRGRMTDEQVGLLIQIRRDRETVRLDLDRFDPVGRAFYLDRIASYTAAFHATQQTTKGSR